MDDETGVQVWQGSIASGKYQRRYNGVQCQLQKGVRSFKGPADFLGEERTPRVFSMGYR